MPHQEKIKISELVPRACGGTPWDVGNKALYEMCRQYPAHKDVGEIVGKIWLIGRAYAAAIERRKEKTDFLRDAFYTDHVAPKLIEWQIDSWLAPLAALDEVDVQSLDAVLACHRQLTQAFYRLTKLDKRSLASKYLHFHFPHLFFIYDTRADQALRLLGSARVNGQPYRADCDKTYSTFCLKVLALRDRIEQEQEIRLSPREIDNLLLEVVRMKAGSLKVKAAVRGFG